MILNAVDYLKNSAPSLLDMLVLAGSSGSASSPPTTVQPDRLATMSLDCVIVRPTLHSRPIKRKVGKQCTNKPAELLIVVLHS